MSKPALLSCLQSTFDVDTSMEVDVDLTEQSQATTTSNITTSSDISSAVEPQQRQIKLTSVLQLRSTIQNDMHSGQSVSGALYCSKTFGIFGFCLIRKNTKLRELIWNSIPHSICSWESLTTFRKHLKVLYFQLAFSAAP